MNDLSAANFCMGCFTQHDAPRDVCPVCGYHESAQALAPHQLRPRSILNGKYLIGRVLGEGGFGITYIGWNINLRVKVAVKEYYPSGFVTRETTAAATVQPFTGTQGDFFSKGRDRFVEEAQNLAKFRSLPGIVAVSDFFTENGTAYIVMEFVEGQTLKTHLEKMGGRLPAEQVFEMMKPVMSSLAEVHLSGMIHRDISPDNLMLSREGSLKLLDFGAARDFTESGNKSMSIMLKPGFAPEEQYRTRGQQGPWTDVYALSATMYRCITGVTPDDSLDRASSDELRTPSVLGVAIDPAREAALMKGMAVFPKDRYQNMPAFSMALFPSAYTPPQTYTPPQQTAPYAPQQTAYAPPQTYTPQQQQAPAYAPQTAYAPQQTYTPPQQAAPYPPQQQAPYATAAAPAGYIQQPFVPVKESWFKRNKGLAISLISAASVVIIAAAVVLVMRLKPSGDPDPVNPPPSGSPSAVSTPSPLPSQPPPSPSQADNGLRPATVSFAGTMYDTDADELWLYDLGITDISELRWFTNLTNLELGFNNISDLSPLRELVNLEYLYLSGNNISDLSPLRDLRNLNTLFLGFNNVSDLSPLRELVNLEYLYLTSNNIRDISVLLDLTNLWMVWVEENPLSSEQVNELKTALPWCDISSDYDGEDVPDPEIGYSEYYSGTYGISLYYPDNWVEYDSYWQLGNEVDLIKANYDADTHRYFETIVREMGSAAAYWFDRERLIYGVFDVVSSSGLTQDDLNNSYMMTLLQEAYEEEFRSQFSWFGTHEDMKSQRMGGHTYFVYKFLGDMYSNDDSYMEYGFYLATTIIDYEMYLFIFSTPDWQIDSYDWMFEEMLSTLSK